MLNLSASFTNFYKSTWEKESEASKLTNCKLETQDQDDTVLMNVEFQIILQQNQISYTPQCGSERVWMFLRRAAPTCLCNWLSSNLNSWRPGIAHWLASHPAVTTHMKFMNNSNRTLWKKTSGYFQKIYWIDKS